MKFPGICPRLIHEDVKQQLQKNMKLYDWIVFFFIMANFIWKWEQLMKCVLFDANWKISRRQASDNEITLPPVDNFECERWLLIGAHKLARLLLIMWNYIFNAWSLGYQHFRKKKLWFSQANIIGQRNPSFCVKKESIWLLIRSENRSVAINITTVDGFIHFEYFALVFGRNALNHTKIVVNSELNWKKNSNKRRTNVILIDALEAAQHALLWCIFPVLNCHYPSAWWWLRPIYRLTPNAL